MQHLDPWREIHLVWLPDFQRNHSLAYDWKGIPIKPHFRLKEVYSSSYVRSESQYKLAITFDPDYGSDPPRNWPGAIYWHRKSAEQEHATAQRILGVACYNEKGLEQALNKAVKWYTKAAKGGDLVAMHKLGLCYFKGPSVELNNAAAVRWYERRRRL
ncbi:hypothetical protein HK097_001214, partial [Rhizophlyctis rosea]